MNLEIASNDSRRGDAQSAHRAGDAKAPRLVTRGTEIRTLVEDARRAGHTVAVIPTMGALHEGHLSLVDAARAECDLTVATIFVNPTQFGPNEDYQRYPRNLAVDLELLASRGCDVVFAPNTDEMDPPGSSTFVDVGPLTQTLEGEIRPAHFRGVATVVLKLFQLVPANRAYFGRKDYQQTLVIRRMVEDLNVPIEVRVCPIVREADGLAMSSRNAYLSPAERESALALSRVLRLAESAVAEGRCEVASLREQMEREIKTHDRVELQYIAFVKDGTLDAVQAVDGPTTVAIAAKVGTTRLIDNILIGQP